MSLGHGASIVRSGLVLHLDAANVKSYPGTGTAWNDMSSSGNNGTLTNGVVYSTNNNGVMTFDGVNDYVECGTNTITGSAAFTLASWFRTTTVSKYSGAISIGGAGNGPYIGTVAAAQVGTSSSIGGGFYGNNWGTGVTTLNTWVYVTMTYASGSNGLTTFYVNDTVRLNQNFSGTPNTPSTLTRIGRIAVDTIYNFSGSIGLTQIYNRSLSAAEVRQNFEATRGRYGI